MIKNSSLTIGFMALYVLFTIVLMYVFGINVFTVILFLFALALLLVVVYATVKGSQESGVKSQEGRKK